jgi:hypothetical protein
MEEYEQINSSFDNTNVIIELGSGEEVSLPTFRPWTKESHFLHSKIRHCTRKLDEFKRKKHLEYFQELGRKNAEAKYISGKTSKKDENILNVETKKRLGAHNNVKKEEVKSMESSREEGKNIDGVSGFTLGIAEGEGEGEEGEEEEREDDEGDVSDQESELDDADVPLLLDELSSYEAQLIKLQSQFHQTAIHCVHIIMKKGVTPIHLFNLYGDPSYKYIIGGIIIKPCKGSKLAQLSLRDGPYSKKVSYFLPF